MNLKKYFYHAIKVNYKQGEIYGGSSSLYMINKNGRLHSYNETQVITDYFLFLMTKKLTETKMIP